MTRSPALLSESNPKTTKGLALGYRTAALMLAPHDLARPGKSICPFSTPACRAECLAFAGRGNMPPVLRARIRRTEFLLDSPAAFRLQLVAEIRSFVVSCARSGHTPAVRLNCLSDLAVERWQNPEPLHGTIMETFPYVQFYDYTKSRARMIHFLMNGMPENYHLTYSRSEETAEPDMLDMIHRGGAQVAVVGSIPAIRHRFEGTVVVNGDEDDLTFLQPRRCIIALSPKGRAKKDTTGFVIR